MGQLFSSADTFKYPSSDAPCNVEERCIFCKISSARLPPGPRSLETCQVLLHETPDLVVFNDISPGAEFHALVVPKKHLKNCFDPAMSSLLLSGMEEAAQEVLRQEGFADRNPRTFFIRPPWNSVDHVHMHIMAGSMIGSRFSLRRLGFENERFHVTPRKVRDTFLVSKL